MTLKYFLFKYLIGSSLIKKIMSIKLINKLIHKYFLNNIQPDLYYIEFSSVCNAECIFCPYVFTRDGGKKIQDMSEKNLSLVLEIIKEFPRKVINLTPSTGEIFMNKKWDKFLSKILELKDVPVITFYSNAALLNDKNAQKLMDLKNFEKFNLKFSSGGINRENYKKLYGKDLFEKVTANLNNFFQKLIINNKKIPISLDIKFLGDDAKKTEFKEINKVYNKNDYKYLRISKRDEYYNINGIINDKNLSYITEYEKRNNKPCTQLNNFRFSADQKIWLCGCVASEATNELEVANLINKKSFLEAKTNQKKIKKDWKDNNIIPDCCKTCTFYSQKLF